MIGFDTSKNSILSDTVRDTLMSERNLSVQEREHQFNSFIIEQYLKYGSVDEVFRHNDYSLPISYPGVQRLITKWGIVKAAGPNSKLSEALCFLSCLSEQKIPLEKLYKQMPPSFKTSMSTLHRILHHIKEGIVRRSGTALVLSSEIDPYSILVGEDISTPRLEVGKPFGSISLPMGYSKTGEEPSDSILRVLQQEVFTRYAIDRNFPISKHKLNFAPFMYLDIADVRVSVYKLQLPDSIATVGNFSSFKLRNFHFTHCEDLLAGGNRGEHFRAGIQEIGLGYSKNIRDKSMLASPAVWQSNLNISLANLALNYSY